MVRTWTTVHLIMMINVDPQYLRMGRPAIRHFDDEVVLKREMNGTPLGTGTSAPDHRRKREMKRSKSVKDESGTEPSW